MRSLTIKERTLLADKLKATSGFLVHFIKVVMVRPELSASAIQNGKELIRFLKNVPKTLPEGFGFNAIIKIYNYAKDSGLDTEPGIFWIAWQAEFNNDTFAFCTHTHTIDENRKKKKNAAYEYKFKVADDGEYIEEIIPYNFENYKVPFLHNAANPEEFKPKGSWLSADIAFSKGNVPAKVTRNLQTM